MAPTYICGFYYMVDNRRLYLPQVKLQAHARIISSISRTTLTQTFVNPSSSAPLKEARYVFPLYDGVSVVDFTCTVGGRVIRGVVQEKQKARQTYDDAVSRGETAGLLEQLPNAADVFTTTVGNIPAGAELRVDITYLGELKHDAEVDGIRFTIPTSIAPRYGDYPGELLRPAATAANTAGGIEITVDAEMPAGSAIRSVQSPTHPLAVSVGTTSTTSPDAEPSLRKASATLSLGSTELDRDFVVQIVATNTANPVAVFERHPTIPDQSALMATLVPKFALPAERPELVFVCDRSGSMGGARIQNLVSALKVFLKSMPMGVKFNICSFGSRYSFLWERSRTYDRSSLDEAMRHLQNFGADYGGTEIYEPIAEVIKRRYSDMNLEIFLITDGEVWAQERIFDLVNKGVEDSKGAIRAFTLGIGANVSHALVEGVSRAGHGFAQTVGEGEKMDAKVVRMLKAALTPHVRDYSLEVRYEADADAGDAMADDDDDDDFTLVDKVDECLRIRSDSPPPAKKGPLVQKVISLFDPSANPDVDIVKEASSADGGKYDHLPAVDPPKILQAPAIIPPLFPFSRTTVYLLFAPGATAHKTPKSVILRGTAPQGPLELEIPVTVLDKPGQTIHQLAARKAVKELEEGRGWIYRATDTNGNLLSKKHDGRFADMVEREAVRLGVQFQVGGKWCSFVAVDPDQNDGEDRATAESVADLAEDSPTEPTRSKRMRQTPPGPFRSNPAFAFRKSSVTTAVPRDRMLARSSASSAPPPPPGGASTHMVQAMPVTMSAFRAAPSPSPYALEMASAASMPLPSEEEEDDDDGAMGFGLFDDVPKPAMKPKHLASPFGTGSALDQVVAAQQFEGFWVWSDGLFRAIGVDPAQVKGALSGLPAGLRGEGRRDVVATACVVLFLRKKLAADKDAWEMMVDKALDWLSGELAGVGTSVEELEKNLEGLF